MPESLQIEKQYGFSCMSRASFHKCLKAFKGGHKSITDDSRSGRPVNVSTPESVQAVEDMIRLDRKVILDDIATK